MKQTHTLTAVELDSAILQWLSKYRRVKQPKEGTPLLTTIRRDSATAVTIEWEE